MTSPALRHSSLLDIDAIILHIKSHKVTMALEMATLLDVLKHGLPHADPLDIMSLHQQLYKRWQRFCEEHGGEVRYIHGNRRVPSLPFSRIHEFMQENIKWATGRLEARMQDMAHAFAPQVVPPSSTGGVPDDDDPDAFSVRVV